LPLGADVPLGVNPSGTAAGFGLISAASWGGSDFAGGFASRRAPALLVVASGHFVSLIVLLAICLGTRAVLPVRHDLAFAAMGGFEGALSLALFYRALAMGAMGLTAALTGVLTALVPVLFSILREGLPAPLTAAGLAVGLAAIWLITHQPAGGAVIDGARQATPPAALLLGAISGLGFGAQLVFFKFAAGGGILWVLTATRVAGVAAMLLVLVVMPPKAPWRGFWLFGILAGALDTVGNLFYIQTTRLGRLDVAAMICSLYPAGTILLAALVLRERPTHRQFAGMALSLAAVALLSI
jgi:drug/metabolite transporter (DMT)-like permease